MNEYTEYVIRGLKKGLKEGSDCEIREALDYMARSKKYSIFQKDNQKAPTRII